MKIYCEHEIPLSAEDFWANIHEPRYESLVAEASGLEEYSELERSETDEAIYRKIHSVPTLSATLQKLFKRVGGSGKVSYDEEQWRAKDCMEVRWKIHPSFGKDRVSLEGVVRIEPIDDTKCKRILDGEVKVRLIGLGSMIEKTIVDTTLETYGKSANVASKLRQPT